eukprot:301701-Chlamydomonas_euryale.AAC.5
MGPALLQLDRSTHGDRTVQLQSSSCITAAPSTLRSRIRESIDPVWQAVCTLGASTRRPGVVVHTSCWHERGRCMLHACRVPCWACFPMQPMRPPCMIAMALAIAE